MNEMLIVILCIALALLIGGIILFNKCDYDWETPGEVMIGFGVTFIIGALAALITLGALVSELPIVDEKIAVCEQYNEEIEATLKETVAQYQAYERETYESFKMPELVAAVNVYPDLKSNEMVVSLIDTYKENRAKIMELELKKLNRKVYMWWICFGE